MKKFIKVIIALGLVHISALIFMSLFRIIFYYAVHEQITPDVACQPLLTMHAFINGIWFDNVIACYVMALPLLTAVICGIAGKWYKYLWGSFCTWFSILYSIIFIAEASNIPYFAYFTKLINASIWNWAEYGTQTLGMIIDEPSYYGYIMLYFITIIPFIILIKYIGKTIPQDSHTASYPLSQHAIAGIIGIFLLGACFLGIRGRLGYNPIKVSAAYFSSSPVLNNIGVNPAFNLITTTLDTFRPENKTLHLMNEQTAISNVKKFYNRSGLADISPIAQVVRPDSAPRRHNVVLVFMESMSVKLMSRFGNKQNLTPYLDSLYNKSLSFSNCYSAGNHTNHGIYASLYSFPAIMYRNAMKGSQIPNYSGLPTVLHDNGYTNMFFMTHESQYDNMNAFLRTNGFDEIYSQENYPRSACVNHFGVPDDFLFNYALPVLNHHAASGKPFFASILTISNHPPYVVPDEFRDPQLKPEQQIVRYADNCIRRFMTEALRQEWSKNTIFVFVGDHGKNTGNADCELPESFNHVPLIIYAPFISPHEYNGFAGQVDIAPTLLGLLRIPYIQNNLGIDLLSCQRPAAFYTADKTIAARDKNNLFVYNASTQTFYSYELKDGIPHQVRESAKSDTLKNYVFSLLQATEYMVQNGMTQDHQQKQKH